MTPKVNARPHHANASHDPTEATGRLFRILRVELAGLVSRNLLLHPFGPLSVAELSGPVLGRLGLPLCGILLGRLERRVLSDRGVGVGVDFLNVVGSDAVFEVGRELLLESFLVFLLEGFHVLGNVATVDVLFQDFGVEFLGFNVETGESLLVVGNVDTTVRGTLDGTEDSVTGRRSLQTDIQERLEGSGFTVTEGLGQGHGSIGFSNTFVLVRQAELGQSSSGTEETGGVGGGPVGETVVDAESGKLLGGGGAEDKVALHTQVISNRAGLNPRPGSPATWRRRSGR